MKLTHVTAEITTDLDILSMAMQEARVSSQLVMDFLLYTKAVKEDGNGSVVLVIREGNEVAIEGKLNRTYRNERTAGNVRLQRRAED